MSQTAAIIGGGVTGAGWAARFVLMGWNVRVFDPDPQVAGRVGAVIAAARRSLPGLSDVALPPEGRLTFHPTLSETVAGAAWIQESVPERRDLKRKIYQVVQDHCDPAAVIGSSTSGFTPSALQGCASRPGQIVVAHPATPVYLLPLVELVASPANPADLVARAGAILSDIGCYPLRLRAEIDGHIAGRLQDAALREARALIDAGIATADDIDTATRLGFGLLWAQMGPLQTSRIADDGAGRDLDQIRDANLVTLLRGLKARDCGAGRFLNAQDNRLSSLPQTLDDCDLTRPVPTLDRAVPFDWTDYNGHMNEARYLQAFGDATDRMMALVGCDMAYVASGVSFFTAETHIRHLAEVRAGARIRVETQVLAGAGKKMHLFHRMSEGDRLLATGEHLLIHVSLTTRAAADPDDRVAVPLARIAAAHAGLSRPSGAGAAVGVRPGTGQPRG